jgi:CheY-like chemotaxis protein
MEYQTKILIVEDEFLNAQYLSSELRGRGYDVPTTPYTGEDAIVCAERDRPDLIIMDINLLGKMDGITAAEIILSKQDVLILFITGYSDQEILTRAKKINPVDIITKPVDVIKMENIIRSALSRKL